MKCVRFSDTNQRTDEEHRTMHLKYLEMKEKYDDLAEKMRFFERVSYLSRFHFVFIRLISGRRYQHERN